MSLSHIFVKLSWVQTLYRHSLVLTMLDFRAFSIREPKFYPLKQQPSKTATNTHKGPKKKKKKVPTNVLPNSSGSWWLYY